MSTGPHPHVLVTADFDTTVAAELDVDSDLTVLPAAGGPEPLLGRLGAAALADCAAIVCETDVADLAFALLLMTVRHTSAAERWMRQGRWDSGELYEPYTLFRGLGLSGRRLGLIGAGAIGRRMARRARGFDMDVLAYDPFASPEQLCDLLRLAELDEVLATSDVVSVHAPLNDATRGLIGAREIALLRPEAYFINAGRAAIVDEDALVQALRSGSIAGAGFDVYWQEPLPKDHPLNDLENVVLTPHVGGISSSSRLCIVFTSSEQ